MLHAFWGSVKEDWAGFSGSILFAHPAFNEPVAVFLGEEFTEELEENDVPPTEPELTEFAETYQEFLAAIDQRISALQSHAYTRYKRYYAGFYENSERSGEPPLGVDTVEKHSQYIKDLRCLRVTASKTLRMVIGYDLDEEHGLEVKFVNGNIEKIGGIAET